MCDDVDGRSPEKFEAKDVSANEIYKFMTTHWQHHNQLSWNKLYVLLALEVAVLTGAFHLRNISPMSAYLLLIVGLFVAIILYQLIQRDWEIRDYCAKHLDVIHKPLGIRMIPPASSPFSHGKSLLLILIIIVGIVNVWAIWLFKSCISR